MPLALNKVRIITQRLLLAGYEFVSFAARAKGGDAQLELATASTFRIVQLQRNLTPHTAAPLCHLKVLLVELRQQRAAATECF